MLRLPKFLLAAAIALSTLSIAPVSAFAHAHPTAMNPAPDTTIASPPRITITFSEALEPKFSSLMIADPQGKPVTKTASHAVAGDPKTLTLDLPALGAGAYVVHWVSVAVDGHRLQGEYKFMVK